VCVQSGFAQQAVTNAPAAPSAGDLAKASQNPVANMISLPIQMNFNGNVGPDNGTQSIINVQPVIPQKINDDWLWIHRTIIPIIDQPSPADRTGVGNIVYEGFLTPAKPGSFIWGVGPVVSLPTVSEQLGNDKWSAGPGALIMKMHGPWVYGALVYDIMSMAGSGDNVHQFLANPFVNYNFKSFYLNSAPIITADWENSADNNQLLVPLGGTIGKVFHFKGMPPTNIRAGGYYNVVHADEAAEWQVQVQVQFMFPK
jgi:hypothetical protein